MTRVISVLNYKGGTGKTTTVVNLSAGLAMRGDRVLCIDLDAQGSLATYLGVEHKPALAQLLLGQASWKSCVVPVRQNFDLIPGDASLLQAEGSLWRMSDNGGARKILLERMQGVAGYDFIILDHSPSASLLNESGLRFSSQVIVPVAMNYLALVGTQQVIQTLNTMDRIPDHDIELALVLPTLFFNRLRKDREVMEILQRYFAGKVADPIRSSVRLAEAPGHKKSIYEYAPKSAGAFDYALLVERVAAND